ncbi:UDP-N-acetylmuramoyl-L-alanine--D-glutamate ligase [Dyadobacter sp. CY312]|uniref:UDP-N-acetylmuramoyl-L-alanine--D-glutamate ligase n=1 Tax=Dyadobacter sp. CY312 TaxID=2907303 RepID=UPI001F3F9A6C|nr:UDP-N-acetylmuramoyl-L-alanine--D-glutamate ligase [Dyadobacter sp. CY312]MCE7044016.1 UDP-N-acetylmuramoyl-L-alanine--D-glutamate ligase [Dyadobacter sp. CY312]
MVSNKLVVLGGGESGLGAAILGKSKGFDVFLSDRGRLHDQYRKELIERGISFEEEQHTESVILDANVVVKSPGIPDTVPLILALVEKGIPVISEIEFAAQYTDAKLIAITGSNGKTTTTLLTYHLLKDAGFNVGLAGNIGDSFAWQVAEKAFDYYVLEISSFQLDNIISFKPDVAVLLNITPDHLDRYGYSFQNYTDSKFNIIKNQTAENHFIYFDDSEVIKTELEKRDVLSKKLGISIDHSVENGIFLEENQLRSNFDKSGFSQDFDKLPIKGPHNAINAMAAILVAQIVGITEDKIKEGLLSFQNAPHRLEKVEVINGVTYINDSKATNVDSVFYALGSFSEPVVLIAGGVDKGNEYGQIEELVRKKVKGLIILSVKYEKLRDYFADIVPQIYITQDVEDAVKQAKKWSEPGDVVLLSPACASFDLFKNYEDRGDQFKVAVRNLA